MQKESTRLILPILLAALLLSAACGTRATPEWAEDAQATSLALAVTDEYLTEIAPTPVPPTPTLIPPTSTLLPPSATPLPPTLTPIPTEAPTEAPTTEATVEVFEAAGGEDAVAEAIAAGDIEAGQAVFNTQHTLPDGSSWACSSCHSVDPSGVRLIGPGLWNVANRDYTEEEYPNNVEYVVNSILHPQEFIAPPGEGQPDWALQMPDGWGEVLSEEELTDLVAYILSLQP